MITKINFSKKSLVFASTGKSFVSFVVQLVLLAALFVWYRFPFIPAVWLFRWWSRRSFS